MTLSFTKFPDKPPVFEVTRDDGSTCWQSSTPFFVLHDLSHYALEKTLGYRTAFLGMVNNGMTLDAFEDRESRSRIQVTEEAWYAECMANLFLTELSQGPFTDFNAVCAATFTAMNQPYPPPVLSETTLQRIRDLLSGLRTQWEALAPKSSLTLTF